VSKKPSSGRIKKKPARFNKKILILGIVLAVVIIGGSAAAFFSMDHNNNSPPTQSNELNDIANKITQPVFQNASAIGSGSANITIVEFGGLQVSLLCEISH
jgi:hypothetical protein